MPEDKIMSKKDWKEFSEELEALDDPVESFDKVIKYIQKKNKEKC
jgi:hypothetical protein